MAKRQMSEAAKEALKKHAFKKGQSGNPNGRPPLPEELKQKMAELTPTALEQIEHLMLNSPNDMVRLKCAEILIAPFVSKAAQKIDVDHNHTHMITDLLAKANSVRSQLGTAQSIEVEFIEVKPDDDENDVA